MKNLNDDVTAEVLLAFGQPSSNCPQCNAPMKLRTARQGSNAGNKFWGCSQFHLTGCKGSRPIRSGFFSTNAVDIVDRCLRNEGPILIGGDFDQAAFTTALRAVGLDGHWEGSLATWMWQVNGEAAFWIRIPRASREGFWHAAKDWFD